jgi:hypothetical protein
MQGEFQASIIIVVRFANKNFIAEKHSFSFRQCRGAVPQ